MQYMTITQVSKHYQISTRMLRYYEKTGLISSSHTEGYAYRIYDESAVRRLQQIIVLRKLRLSLKEIGMILNDEDQIKCLAIFSEKIKEFDSEIAAIQTVKNLLQSIKIKLEQNGAGKTSFKLFSDRELIELTQSLTPQKNNFKEKYDMNNLKEADRVIHQLKDDQVRIIQLPPMTVAAIHTTGNGCEAKNLQVLRSFIKQTGLCSIKPDFRVLGFNNDEGECHGYEHWITIPDDLLLPAPFIKKKFDGGLYGAFMIQMGNFEGWKWLDEWAGANKQYEMERRAPEAMCGCLEEHLNFINIFDNDMEVLDQVMQLDLLIPVKKKSPVL